MADQGGDRRQAVREALGKQVGWCESLGSPFTAAVLAVLAEDVAAGGALTADIAQWPGDPTADALPLRLAGALHALVLTDAAPSLAACYPPAAPTGLADAVRAAVAAHAPFIAAFIASPPQTNEVGRSAVLLGGFLHIAAATGLPLRLLEIGASAGLNLVWDRYRYDLGGLAWGDPGSTLRLTPAWQGAPPAAPGALRVAERRGCDIAPIDLRDPVQRLRLRAYVWADQPDRLDRLDRAIAIAAASPFRVEQADAAAWVGARLREPGDGRATVLYHSIMWQYMPQATRHAIERDIVQAGAAATPAAPFAWLRFEPSRPETRPALSLTLWPGAHHHTLASAHAHGSAVTWLGAAAATPAPP